MFQISIDLIALVAFHPHTAVHWADKNTDTLKPVAKRKFCTYCTCGPEYLLQWKWDKL